MNFLSRNFLVHDGILNITNDDKIIGIFDIEHKVYYKINPDDLGETVFLSLIPYKPHNGDFGSIATCYPRSIYNYRRLKIYEIKIRTEEFPETSTIKTALGDGLGWFSTIFMTDGTKYQYSYLLGTWRELVSWGPHTIEIKEMKKENTTMTEMDRLTYNYCASDAIATADLYKHFTNSLYGIKSKNKHLPEIKNVVISDPYTTILWSDGSKTQVKCMEGDTFDPEHGFAMAVLKKLMEKPDKPNAYSKWVKQWVKQGIEAGKKQAARKNKKAEKKAEKETCDSCSWTFDQDGNVQTGPTNVDYSNT